MNAMPKYAYDNRQTRERGRVQSLAHYKANQNIFVGNDTYEERKRQIQIQEAYLREQARARQQQAEQKRMMQYAMMQRQKAAMEAKRQKDMRVLEEARKHYLLRKDEERRRREVYERDAMFRSNANAGGRQIAYAGTVAENFMETQIQPVKQYKKENKADYKKIVRKQLKKTPVHGFDMAAAGELAVNYDGIRPVAEKINAGKKRGIVSTIVLVIAVFAVLSGVLVRYAQVSDARYAGAQTQMRIKTLQQQIDKVKTDIALRENLSSIQSGATNNLGMGQAKDNQIVFVPPMVSQTAEPQVSEPETAEQVPETTMGVGRFFEELVNAVKGLFANFEV